MAKIFKKLGVAVDYPQEQTCCGQPAFNAGYCEESTRFAARFIAIFGKSSAIVAPSGSCVSMVKHYYRELPLPERLKSSVGEIAERTHEFSEYLVRQLGVVDLGVEFPHRVTYHDSCHLLRELGVKDEPRRLLESVKGLDLIEMERPDSCCGFGGSFSLKFPSLSGAIGDEKVARIAASGAEYVVSADAGCLMQMTGALGTVRSSVKGIHLAELLGRGL